MTEPIDTSTLAWVQSEASSCIDRVRESLDRFVADISDMTPLRVAGAEMRQLSGTLKMTELDYTADVADELERLIASGADSGNSKRAESSLIFIHHGLDVLGAIIERLDVTGRDNQLTTISIINELRAVRGAELIDLASVFRPDIHLPLPAEVESQPVETVDTSAERRQFQECLLAWVNNKGPADVLAKMADVFGHLRSGAGAEQWRKLWWIAEAFTATRGFSVTLSDRTAVAMFRRLDQHIRRFDEAGSTADIDDDLVVHLLYAILLSEQRDGVAGRVVETFNLLGSPPSSEDDNRLFSIAGAAPLADANQAPEPSASPDTRSALQIQAYLTQVQPDIKSCANLIESMLAAESVSPESVVQLGNILSALNRSEDGSRLGPVGKLVNELDLCLATVNGSEQPMSRALQLRVANGLMLLQRLATDEIELDDSEEELLASSRYLHNEYTRSQPRAAAAPAQNEFDSSRLAVAASDSAARLLSTPMAAQSDYETEPAIETATGVSVEAAGETADTGADVGVLERPGPETELHQNTTQSVHTTPVASASESTAGTGGGRNAIPANEDAQVTGTSDDVADAEPSPEAWLAAHMHAVKQVLADFSHAQIDDESRARMSEWMDEIVGLLDDLGHTRAGDVFDYCRRVVSGLVSGRLVSHTSIVSSVDAGIAAVESHVGLGTHDAPLQLDSLTAAEQTLREQLATARATVVPLDTMRQNLLDFLAEWRRSGSTRDDWRNYRTALDDINAFAELNDQADLGRRVTRLMEISTGLMGRLSNPDQQDIDRLGRARDSVLVALARRANRETHSQPTARSVPAAQSHQSRNDDRSVEVVEEALDEADSTGASDADLPVAAAASATDAASMPEDLIAVRETLRHIRHSMENLSASPDSRDRASEVALGLLLVREKCENNGARAAADVARISERLLGEVTSQVVPVTPALNQFLTIACDRIDHLIKFSPVEEASSDIDAWKQAAANVRVGHDPVPCLGEEAIFIDDGLIDSSPLSESRAASDQPEPDSAKAPDPPPARTGESVPADAVSAGTLVQQVLANVGMDAHGNPVEDAASGQTPQTREELAPSDVAAESTERLHDPNDVLFDSTATATTGGISDSVSATNPEAAAPTAAPAAASHRLSAPRSIADDSLNDESREHAATVEEPVADDPTSPAESDLLTSAAEMSPSGRRAEGANVDVMIGEAMAHTAYLGQWIEQTGSAGDVCPVSEDLSSAVNVLRAITRVIGVDSVAAPFEPLHGLLELLRRESLPLAAEERDFIKRTGRLTDASLVILSDNRAVSDSQQRELQQLTAQLDGRLLQLEARIAEQGSQNPEQIPIKIIGDDIVTLEQLAGGQTSDQLDLDRLFREESSELCKRIREGTARWRDENFSREARSDLLHEFHTLKGNARTAGFPEAAALAHSLETLLGQQNPNHQPDGLHGEEVVIYLNQAALVLAEFIDQPDSERSREALEALKRRVDAQCFSDSDSSAVQAAPVPREDDIDQVIKEQAIRTRDLATVASTSYAYDGFVDHELDRTPPAAADSDVNKPAFASVPATTPIVLDRVETEAERTLPNSLMAPATVIAESGGQVQEGYDDVEEFETRADQLVQPTRDAVSAASDLVEKVADNLGDIQAMSRSLNIDLETLSELNDEYDMRLSRVVEQLSEFESSSAQLGYAHELSRSSAEALKTELSSLHRLRERIATVTSQLRNVIGRHDDRIANLRDELKRLRGVAFETIAPRLRLVVRQSSSQLMKDTRFILRGGEVEVDRHIVESLLGSLENLLRNAVVHGIEFPERRRQVGKSPTGIIQISVRRDLDDLVIEVSDDGAGIDYSAIQQIAGESLTESTQPELEADDERQLIDRMFDVGVTTVSEVTELAGRGVGLDVVRKTVGLLGGEVEVRSERGRGSCFVIRLPAQAETIKARIVEARGYSVAIAEHHVQAAVQLTMSQLTRLLDSENQTIDIEGRVFPFLKLREALKLPERAEAGTPSKITILLLQLSHGEVALEIEAKTSVSQVVRQPRKAGSRKPAMVLATFNTIEWLDIDTLWSQSAVYSLGERAQRAFRFGREDIVRAPSRSASRANPVEPIVEVSAAQSARLANRSVVFVADSRDIAPELIGELEARKMKIEIAPRSSQAIELIENSRAHAVVVDLDLPGGDGFELVHQLHKMDKFADLPTIVVSSIDDDFRRQQLDRLKVAAVMAKPCDNDQLVQKIEALPGPRYLD